MKSLCVFCGSKTGSPPVYADAARQLGRIMAEEGLTLVYGGGHIGLMGVIADAVLEGGGTVIGVIPQALVDRELAHTRATEMHIVRTMHERKALMVEKSEAFVALPGGYGTGDELFEILTWAQLHIHHHPVGLLNCAGYFDSLLAWVDRMVADGFLTPDNRKLLRVADEPRAVLRLLRE